MLIDIPSGLKAKFYSPGQVGERFWKVLAARLTGKKQPDGSQYYSEVNLNKVQVNKVIRNMKKDPRGIFVLEADNPTPDDMKNYQEWLVDQYLKNEIESRDVPNLDDLLEDIKTESKPNPPIELDDLIKSIQNEDEEGDEPVPSGFDELLKQVREAPTQEEQQQKQEVASRIRTRTIRPNPAKLLGLPGITLGQLANVDSAVDNAPGDFVIRYNRRTNQYYAVDPKELISSSDTPVTQSGEENKKVIDTLTSINKSVSKILEVLEEQNKLFKKRQESERKRIETERRQKRENFLEKGIKNIASSAVKMLAPVQNLIDKILNFLWYTLLGKAFVNFIKWFNNPENKERVEFLKRFLKDWWPALLGGLVLFTTPFGKFVRAFVGTVTKFTFKLAKSGIPKLLGLIAKYPKTAAVIGAGAAAAGIGMYMQSRGEKQDKELQKSDPEYGKKPSPMKSMLDFGSRSGLGFAGGGMIPLAKAFAGGGEATQLQPFEGGYVDDSTGLTVTGAGADTQATVLQPGEVVFSKKAVDYWGADRLLYMNKMGGGTNIPKFVNNVQLAQGGGMIGKAVYHLKQDEALSSLTKGMNDFIKPGGRSAISKINWGNIKSETPIHSYKDSVGQPTIGWGSTFYDSILSGKKPVKMGDTITKKQADNILSTNLGNLAKTYSRKIPLWNKMSNNQKAGVLTLGYNAPYGPIGAFPRLTDALIKGDMQSAATNVQRGGPSTARLSIEKQLLLSGPKDLTKAQQPPKAQVKPKEPSLFDKVKTNIMNFFSPKPAINIGPPVSSINQNIIELPPIVQQAGQKVASSGGTKVPQFTPPDNVSARINASIYGIA
jgi:GH24 family phage-related lysozyme (muramidase)